MSTFQVNKDGVLYKWLAFYYCAINFYTSSNGITFREWQKEKHGSSRGYYENYCLDRPYEFCMLWRHVLLWPLVRFAISTAFFIVAGILLATFGTAVFGGFWNAVYGLAVIVGVALLLGVIIAFLMALDNLPKWVKRANRAITSNDFVKEAYSSYKNKYCKTVEYTKESNNG